MKSQSLILVLSEADVPQLAMLANVPHAVVGSLSELETAPRTANVIFYWTGSRELLRAAFLQSPHVRWVHTRTAGLDSILFPELAQSDVPLTNGRGVFSPSLGEFALAVILYFAKDFRRMLHNQEAGRWAPFTVEEVAGQTVGIVGYGDIGRAVAGRVRAMGMRVLALKRSAATARDPLVDHFYRPNEMAAMLALCDYIVVAAPLTPETRHLLGDAVFARMKPTAVVINIGRGPVIDQAALVRALTEKRIRGAGLDVFEQEPIPPNDPIYKLENVLVSPHCADQTSEWLNRAIHFFLAQYERFCAGQPLQNIVDKQSGY